jgi:hypothetical protein
MFLPINVDSSSPKTRPIGGLDFSGKCLDEASTRSVQQSETSSAEPIRRKEFVKHKILVVMAVLATTLAFAASAFAGGSGGSMVAGYGGVAGQANTQVKSPATPATTTTNTQVTSSASPATTTTTAPAAATPAGSTLPFTGFDVGLVVFGGALVLLVGFVLNRTARKNQS